MTSPQQNSLEAHAYYTALQFYQSCGVDVALLDDAQDRRKALCGVNDSAPSRVLSNAGEAKQKALASSTTVKSGAPQAGLIGSKEARSQAIQIAKSANSLDALKDGIAQFEGLSVRRTASNMVFSDGHKDAPVMVIGEAPGTEEDRAGSPFVGQSGQLLDRMFGAIDLARDSQDPQKNIYITNILNWRPPGNRSPSQGEIEVSLPFIEKHIMLVQPKIIVLSGSVAAKALLGRSESISRLRGAWHAYRPLTSELGYTEPAIPAIATYHPAYLLRTPVQKRAAWADLLEITHKLKSL